MNDVKLSIVLISYKQEKYIRTAIDSILNQKVNFKYELLLADDCSPDNTMNILKEYKKKYPNIIKILERKKNLGASNNLLDACFKTKGEYITILEGDDYWCDNNKIQTQVDFLDKNKEYIAVTHLQEWRNSQNVVIDYTPRFIKKDRDITLKDYLHGFSFSSSATLHRNIFLNEELNEEITYIHKLDPIVGDSQKCFFLLTLGKIRLLCKPMMVYRFVNTSGESNYNSTHNRMDLTKSIINIYTKLNDYYNNKYNFYYKLLYSVSAAFIYCVSNKCIKEFSEIMDICPKQYKLSIILGIPFCIMKIVFTKMKNILYNIFRKK